MPQERRRITENTFTLGILIVFLGACLGIMFNLVLDRIKAIEERVDRLEVKYNAHIDKENARRR